MKTTIEPERRRPAQAVWRITPYAIAVTILLLPLIAMLITDDVQWGAMDFVIMGAMLFVACGAFELATRLSRSVAYRAAAGIAVVAAFILVWINLAVGIIGSEGNPANLMFAAILAIGLVGALLARLRPRGMARAMGAMALAQITVGAIILIGGLGAGAANWPWPHVALTAAYTMIWLASAWLFGRAEPEGLRVRM